MSAESAFAELVEIMRRLRAPGGCPWDAEQTHDTLRPYLIEEAYEVLEALDSGVDDDLRDELGDVLLQVVFHSELAVERGAFSVEDVVRGLSSKLVRRHPHVFDDVAVADSDEVRTNWLRIKAEEKAARGESPAPPSILDGVPNDLPTLLKAHRLGRKAESAGFDWTDPDAVREKILEELAEVDDARTTGEADAVEAEIGDLLFAVASYARHLGVNADTALRRALATFTSRVHRVEEGARNDGVELKSLDTNALDRRWQAAKEAAQTAAQNASQKAAKEAAKKSGQ